MCTIPYDQCYATDCLALIADKARFICFSLLIFMNVRMGSAIQLIIIANHNFNTKYITQPKSGSIKKTLGVIDVRAFHPDTMPANMVKKANVLATLL